MDAKQFDLFQRTIQYAKDEMAAAEQENRETQFEMGSWLSLTGKSFRGLRKDAEVTDVPLVNSGFGLSATYLVLPEIAVGSCGTAACLAGTAVMLHGDDRFVVRKVDADRDNGIDLDKVLTRDNRVMEIEDRARELFGLTERECNQLFYMVVDNTDDMQEMIGLATRIAKRHGHDLEVI